MGAWDSGPFDNDTAADWCGDLDDATAAQRPALVREALARAAGEDGYLDVDVACEAVAAAAIVAAQLPGGQPVTSPYAPDFLLDGGRQPVRRHQGFRDEFGLCGGVRSG